MLIKMFVRKYMASRMYGFLGTSQGRDVFFHLGSFRPQEEEIDPVPPIPGETVDVEVDFDSQNGEKAPRASRVCRLTLPVVQVGVVDLFDATFGYGFINCQGEMYFLHKSEIRDGKVPLVGDRVRFYPGMREGKSRACHVTVLRDK